MKLITGNEERMYVNTALGCKGNCKYCYLPQLGITETKYFSTQEVLEEFRLFPFFRQGKQGTIISIGCYSESLNTNSKKHTIELIKYFSQYNNYIQLSTKQTFSYEEFKEIDMNLKYRGQLHIYISMPTLTFADDIEPNCAKPEKRIVSIEESTKFKNIKVYLYIKPVIDNVTIKDVNKYKELMQKYHIDSVVGDVLYQGDQGKNPIQVGEHFFYEGHTTDAQKIREELSKVGEVYKNSTDTIKGLTIMKRKISSL